MFKRIGEMHIDVHQPFYNVQIYTYNGNQQGAIFYIAYLQHFRS